MITAMSPTPTNPRFTDGEVHHLSKSSNVSTKLMLYSLLHESLDEVVTVIW